MSTDVVIIGAGLSGLTAARILTEQNLSVLVAEKSKGVGGRLATRRIKSASLDHGAQFFTARTDEFKAAVNVWTEAGIVDEWCRGFGHEDGYPRYRVRGGMNSLAKALAVDINVAKSQKVSAIIPTPDCWSVTYDAGTRLPDEARAVVATAPVPQVLELTSSGAVVLDDDVATELEAMRYNKVIAILMRVDKSPNIPTPGAIQQPDDPTFTFIADNQVKGISSEPAVTFHVSHQLSDELWDKSDREIVDALSAQLSSYCQPARPIEAQVKRWRYAGPVQPTPKLCLVATTKPGPLVIAGDGFGGSKVEGAFISGLAAAAEIASRLGA